MRQMTLFLCLLLLSMPAGLLAAETKEQLTIEQATKILSGIEGEVISVENTEISGFFLVGMKMQGQTVPLYLDKSGTFLFSGNVINLTQRKNLTEDHFAKLNPINVSEIPLENALLLGNPEASQQTIVFTDPDCPYCSKLHKVLLEAVEADTDLAFQIIVTPLKESSYQTAKTILCNKSMDQLEQALAGTSLTVTECESNAVDNNKELARSLGIRGTPTMILPNGQLKPGYRPLNELLELIGSNKAQAIN
jgi:thiol:disulfide interchange protein DsbC